MLCQREEREAGRAYPRTCPTCRLGPCQKFGAKPLQSLSDAQAEIARLTAEATFLKGLMDQRTVTIRNLEGERDQALACAAAAAMDMRERAHNAACVRRSVGEILKAIRALPIDPDAQKALDKMLDEAFEQGTLAAWNAAYATEANGGNRGDVINAVHAAVSKKRPKEEQS